jgi:hypothetical protein
VDAIRSRVAGQYKLIELDLLVSSSLTLSGTDDIRRRIEGSLGVELNALNGNGNGINGNGNGAHGINGNGNGNGAVVTCRNTGKSLICSDENIGSVRVSFIPTQNVVDARLDDAVDDSNDDVEFSGTSGNSNHNAVSGALLRKSSSLRARKEPSDSSVRRSSLYTPRRKKYRTSAMINKTEEEPTPKSDPTVIEVDAEKETFKKEPTFFSAPYPDVAVSDVLNPRPGSTHQTVIFPYESCNCGGQVQNTKPSIILVPVGSAQVIKSKGAEPFTAPMPGWEGYVPREILEKEAEERGHVEVV